MKLQNTHIHGNTLTETMVGTGLTSVVSLAIYSLLGIGMILGAKNTATNTAHQQARTAMSQMLQNLHSAVSLPQLVDITGNVTSGPAAGISFQLWSIGPGRVVSDAAIGQTVVQVTLPAGTNAPVAGQRLIVPTHQIEDDISAVSASGGSYSLTLAHGLTAAISGTQGPTNYNIVCYITDRCSYIVKNQQLEWKGPTQQASVVKGSDITSPAPFSTPNTPAGALYYRFVAAIDLSTCDVAYSNRGFKSANILLNGQVPMRARLTTYQ